MNAVVAGVDDSGESLRAVEWAAGEAERSGRPLRILHAFIWPLLKAPLGPAPGAPPGGGLRHAAERVLATALDRARTAAPGVDVTGDLPEGEPVTALLEHSRRADLVVIGSRGLGELGGLLLGSVGARLAAEACCPVVVVRGPFPPRGPVVVGVGGDDEAALSFAFAHADRTANPLVVVHAGEGAPDVSEWRERFPAVAVAEESLAGRPGKALIRAASGASLLVVGSHQHHELSALLRGSVSQAVLHHAGCPVAVVRA